jgi:hypothetical protein
LAAVARYELAIRCRFDTAVIYNNLGYCYLQLKRKPFLDKARENLLRAVQKDAGLRVAWRNVALVDLEKATQDLKRTYVPLQGIEALRQALAKGPAPAEWYYDGARLCGFAAYRVDPTKAKSWELQGVAYLRQAAERGYPRDQWEGDPLLGNLPRLFRGGEAPRALAAVPPAAVCSPVLDPSDGD